MRWALAGGMFASAGVFVVTALVGRVSSFEAKRLVEGIKSTATFAASTYVASGATVLALMATMIAFSISHDSEFRKSHYRRLRMIAGATTALILVSLALLACLVVPIAEADVPANGYIILYWAIVVLGSIGGGLMVTIVLMLNYAVRGLIDLGTDGESFLTVEEEADEPVDDTGSTRSERPSGLDRESAGIGTGRAPTEFSS